MASRLGIPASAALLFLLMLNAFSLSSQPAKPAKPTKHVEQDVEGWKVRVDERLLKGSAEDRKVGDRALRILSNRLFDVAMVVPKAKLERLRQVTIQIDLTHGELRPAQYHPSVGWLKENGYDSALAKCVHIPDAADFASTDHQRIQPWSVLHELAHAYHDQVLKFDHPEVASAWRKLKAKDRYQKILHIDGRLTKHYALTNPQEFFAEMTESFFGVNDFFPFNRAELQREEPEIYSLLEQIWVK